MMLVSDTALLRDEQYLALVEKYAKDIKALENDFKHAWYKLTTNDLGPKSRCVGKDVPDAQPFQNSVAVATQASSKLDWKKLDADVEDAIKRLGDDCRQNYGPWFAELAY